MVSKEKTQKKQKAGAQVQRADLVLVAEAERRVRAAGALTRGELTKLAKHALVDLEEQLLARGLEPCSKSKGIRAPLEAQILALVQGGHQRRGGMAGALKGAVRAEIDLTVQRLVEAGRVHIVVRTEEEVLVGGTERVLSGPDLARFIRMVERLTGVLSKLTAKGGPRGLLREDVKRSAEELLQLSGPAPAPEPRLLVEAALHRLVDPSLKLVPIPRLVRDLAGQLSTEEVHRALHEAATRGLIELRPDGGSEFLSHDDARLCPRGQRDTVFSRARLVSL